MTIEFNIGGVSIVCLGLGHRGLSAYKLPATGSGELAKDLQDFQDLIPMEKANKLVRAYLAQDKEFRTAVEVLNSKELNHFIMDLEAAPEYAELYAFMQKAGLDAYSLLKESNELLENRRFLATDFADTRITGGLLGFIIDFNSLVSVEKTQALLEEKLAAGGAVADNVHYQILVRDAELKNVNPVLFQQLFSFLTDVNLGIF
nr:uncharacterized protein LOC117228913 [Megalopta genalis]